MTSFSSAAFTCAGLLRRKAAPAAGLLLLTACNGLGEAMSAHTDVVARAPGKEQPVEEAVENQASNPQIPPDPEVARALADLWIDYALLATAVAEDSSLTALDMEAFIEPVREQALVVRLREQVIEVDTVFDEAEVQRRWALEGPGAEISARHILLRLPPNATDAQRDSVEQLADALRGRAAGGESFEDLAREYSEDPGSAARGGDLGFFSRGRMVQPFEEAAFALEAGEVSEVVETPFGYHIILVEERRQPELGDERQQFREFLVQQAVQSAELEYLESLADEVNVQVPAENLAVAREIAGRPDRSLSGRQGTRPIATYEGGEFTAAEFTEFLQTQPPQVQTAFASATDEQLENAVRQLVQMELLLAEVEERGITLPAEEEERIRTDARQTIRQLTEATGFVAAARQGADSSALDAHVNELVQAIVSGGAEFVPLGRLGVILRDLYPHEINEESFSAVVSQLEVIRAQQAPPPPVPGAPGQPPTDPAMPGQPMPTEPMPMDSMAAPPPATPPAGQ
ncbi:MAG: peptidylprolyl isomerase [Gemmatimonadota bacterium]